MGTIGIIILVYLIFTAYFIFKYFQFFIQATKLYKKMIVRQEAMLNLLLDIRDNTKNYSSQKFEDIEKSYFNEPKEAFKICETCNTRLPVNLKHCPKCGNKFD